jgi:hypothetical protein
MLKINFSITFANAFGVHSKENRQVVNFNVHP